MFKFLKKKKPKKDIFEIGEINLKNIDLLEEHDFLVSLVYANDFINTIYPACAACYNISPDKNTKYEERCAYIGRRVKSGHTSILEHSNIILQAFIPLKEVNGNLIEIIKENNPNITTDLSILSETNQSIISLVSEVRDVCRYLTIKTDYIYSDNNAIMRLTIGGSIRGYRYIFENIENRNNKLFIAIFDVLKDNIPEDLFIDFIQNEAMNDYAYFSHKGSYKNLPQSVLHNFTSDTIDIINMDEIKTISELCNLKMEDCFDFVSITVNFKKMSRIITQQVTRHRNGITQESQRYVNYSTAEFNSPDKFKDKYDKNKKYDTQLGSYKLQELGDALKLFYKDLVDQGLDKEDARGYLPQNIQCSALYMTFTLRSLFVFLNLRLDKHSQAEIRRYAEILEDLTEIESLQLDMNNMKEASNYYSQALYLRQQLFQDSLYKEIDEEV